MRARGTQPPTTSSFTPALLHVVVAPCDFVDGRTGAAVLVFQMCAHRPSLALEELQDFADRCVTGTPGNVGARFSYSPATRGLAAPLGEMQPFRPGFLSVQALLEKRTINGADDSRRPPRERPKPKALKPEAEASRLLFFSSLLVWTLQGRIQPLATVPSGLRRLRPEVDSHARQYHRDTGEDTHAADYRVGPTTGWGVRLD